MKKLQKITACLCIMTLLLAALWTPINVSAAEKGKGDTYAFYGFENGQTAQVDTTTVFTDSAGDPFYALRSSSSNSKTEQVTIPVSENGKVYQRGALKISSYTNTSCLIITDANGKPFEAKPGTSYTIRVKAYVGMFGKWSQGFFGFGTYQPEVGGEPAATEFTNFGRATYSAADGYGMTERQAAAKYPVYDIGSCFYQDWGLSYKSDDSTTANCRYYTDISTDNKYQCYEITSQVTTGNFSLLTTEGDTATAKPYLMLFLSGGGLTIGGETIPSTLYLDYIEVYQTDRYDGNATVSFYDGTTKLAGSTVTVGGELPTVIPPNGKAFGGWYLDEGLTIPYPEEKVDRLNLTLYGRYAWANDRVTVRYYNGDSLLLSENLRVNSRLWNGAGGVKDRAFVGWYTDKALTRLYDSPNTGVDDLVLYGKYVPYTGNVTLSNWKTRPEQLNVYTVYDNKVVTRFAAGGWNYGDVDAYERPNGELTLGNRCTWVQGGGVILYDPDTEAVLQPAPATTYRVTVQYTVPDMDATTASLSFGYGISKSYLKGMNGNGASKTVNLATVTEATNTVQTVSALITVPAVTDDDVMPCFVVGARIGGRKDASNNNPVTCLAVRQIKLEVVPHTSGEWRVVQGPTCKTPGVNGHFCAVCGEMYETAPIATVGHTWGDWMTDVPATCSKAGTSVRMCVVCGAEDYGTISKTSHGSTSWKTTDPAGCTAGGTASRVCNDCGTVLETKTIPSTGHLYQWVDTVAPTCAAEGTHAYQCVVCGHVQKTESVSKTAHTPGEWRVKIPAGCGTEGTEELHCAVCDCVMDSRPVAALEHTEDRMMVATAPTKTTKGLAEFHCKNCGVLLRTEEIPTTNGKIYSETVSAAPGEAIQVPVRVSDNPGFIAGLIKVGYNTDDLLYTGYSAGSIITAKDLTVGTPTDGTVNVLIYSGGTNQLNGSTVTKNGVLIYLNFTVKAGAETSDVTLTVDPNSGFVNNQNPPKLVFFTTENARVQIGSAVYGDANSDGIVDTTDLALVKKYLAGLVDRKDVGDWADCSGDGSIDTTDLMLLKKYLAGLIDDLGPVQ